MSIGLTEPTIATKPKGKKRASVKTDGRKAPRKDGRVKNTLLLDGNLDIVLSSVAAEQHLDRSQLTAQILYAGLQRYALGKVLIQHLGVSLSTGEDRQCGDAA